MNIIEKYLASWKNGRPAPELKSPAIEPQGNITSSAPTAQSVFASIAERHAYELERTERANAMILSKPMQRFLISIIDEMIDTQMSRIWSGMELRDDTFDICISIDKLPCDDWIPCANGPRHYDEHECLIISMGGWCYSPGTSSILKNLQKEGYFGQTEWTNMMREFGYRSDVEALEDTALAIAYVLEHEYQDKRGFVYSEQCDVGGKAWKTYHFHLRLPESDESELGGGSSECAEPIALRTSFK